MHAVPSLGAVVFPDTDVGSARGLVEETSMQMRLSRRNTKPLNSRRERDIHIWRKVPFPQDISIPFICFWVWTIKAEPNAFVIRDASEGLSGGEKKSRVLLANWGISPHPTDPSLAQFLNLLCPPGPHWALSLSHTCSVWPWQSKGSSLYGAAEPKCTQESERAVYNKP